jgi:acylphosphatase
MMSARLRKQYHIIVRGFVQGIGYRAFIRREAQKINVTGWVRNREDDAVEAVLQGPTLAVQALLKKVKIGPSGSHIKHIDVVQEVITQPYAEFEVIY